ncbi:MAG: hypothetical protein M9894_13490 [Planctomycetes bacterium]|nr:hypothetical protein [Planctomycetota bacterium]
MVPPRALVVSARFARRNSYAAALEAEGWLALEAASVEEALWCLITSRVSDGRIDLVVADADASGLATLLDELAAWSPQPAAVVVGGVAPPDLPPFVRSVEGLDALRGSLVVRSV